MSAQKKIHIFWFRRDLRLDDNAGLYHALKSDMPVLPLFIFDTEILDKLEDKNDKRVVFIHQEISRLSKQLQDYGSDLLVKVGKPLEVWEALLKEYSIEKVYTNHDYEPYAQQRDRAVEKLCQSHDCAFLSFKDQCIFEKNEVLKDDGKPYTVFTPYSKKWLAKLNDFYLKSYPTLKYLKNLHPFKTSIPSLADIGFKDTSFKEPKRSATEELLYNYAQKRDFPSVEGTSRLGMHLRFGTISIRKLATQAQKHSAVYLSELIWREFYMMILFHFPHVVDYSFKPQYDKVKWVNDEKLFEKWCAGNTGYPIVDAGMRQLNETGFMHNRVRMITASFLIKHLLIDWRWGEAYFGQKLLDYDLAANNGGWQWAASSGCDAAPYFRVFNPTLQMEKFDPKLEYVKKWVPEYGTSAYPQPIIDHDFARKRVIEVYKKALF